MTKKDVVLEEFERNRCKGVYRVVKQKDVNNILYRWFCMARKYGYVITGAVLKEKALYIAAEIGIKTSEFFASEDGSRDGRKKQH
jgi:hypothetical protein